MKKKLNLGIIGAGYWSNNILSTLEKLGYLSLKVYDIYDKNLIQAKKNFPKIKIYNTLYSFLSNKYDAVFIVTPPNTHYKLAKICLENNFNIFVEKPATLNSKNLKRLKIISNKRKKLIFVGYLYKFNVYINYIKKILRQQVLGKINYIIFERLNLGPVRSNYSCFWDLASHDISTLINFFGNKIKVKKVIGHDFLKKKVFDIGSVFLEIKKIKIEIKSSWLSPEKIRKIIIVGAKKMLLFDEMNKKETIKIYNKYAKYPKISEFKKNFFTPSANIFLGKTFSPKIEFKAPLEAEILYFLKLISSKNLEIKKSNIDDAIKVLNILETIDKKKFNDFTN